MVLSIEVSKSRREFSNERLNLAIGSRTLLKRCASFGNSGIERTRVTTGHTRIGTDTHIGNCTGSISDSFMQTGESCNLTLVNLQDVPIYRRRKVGRRTYIINSGIAISGGIVTTKDTIYVAIFLNKFMGNPLCSRHTNQTPRITSGAGLEIRGILITTVLHDARTVGSSSNVPDSSRIGFVSNDMSEPPTCFALPSFPYRAEESTHIVIADAVVTVGKRNHIGLSLHNGSLQFFDSSIFGTGRRSLCLAKRCAEFIISSIRKLSWINTCFKTQTLGVSNHFLQTQCSCNLRLGHRNQLHV